jgi:hypothetical protein
MPDVRIGLAAEIERQKQRELIAALDANEAAMAAEVAKTIGPTQIELTDRVRMRLAEFAKWAAQHNIRACAAKPATVAMWVLSHRHLGADAAMEMLAAVAAIHDYHGLSNPTQTAIVCRAIEAVFKAEPPRSWDREAKLLFATLPQTIQQVIGKRERDRERELRSCQNRAAKAEKKLKPDAPKEAVTTEKEKV